MDIVNKLLELFSGNEKAHGEYVIVESDIKGKVKGKAQTVKGPLTEKHWENHIKGITGIGIIPIRSDNTCLWGCIDIDIYSGLDLEELSNKLPKELTLFRSKSGGAHIYIFMAQPAPAALIRKKLSLVARLLNYPDAEIFPKQEKLVDKQVGNWINAAYFNSEATSRYCIKNGLSLELEEFVNIANDLRLSLEELVAFDPAAMLEIPNDEEFADAPPCLQHLVKHGFPVGSKNNGLFSMGVYAKMKFVNGWEDKVYEYNIRFMGPGTYSEVSTIIKNLQKRTYVYKCSDIPICTYCDKITCRTVPFGIKADDKEEKNKRPCVLDDVDKVVCYIPLPGSKDEPTWVFTIGEVNFDVSVEMIKNQSYFTREYIRVFLRCPLPVKDVRWNMALNKLLESAEICESPSDSGPEGQFWIHLEEFVSSKSRAKVKDEILLGKPYYEHGRIFFRSVDLAKYLDLQRFRHFREADVWSILRRKDAKHYKFNIKGKCVAVWSIEEFSLQNEGFDIKGVPYETEY